MAIRGATPRACFDLFVEHLNKLVHATLPTKVPLDVETRADRPNVGTLGFRGAYTVPLKTKHHKTVHFHLGQFLECTEKPDAPGGLFGLSTRQYWYRIQLEPDEANAVLRWQYLSPRLPRYADEGKRWCWRHLHMPQEVRLSKGALDLDKVHLPTGYVIIEDVIRFLVHDLGVKPPCGKHRWHELLLESEAKFHRDFNTKFRE